MLTGIAPLVVLETSRSFSMKMIAGARIEEANGDMKVIIERRQTISHFWLFLKLSGMVGSSSLSQPTISLSKSEVGIMGDDDSSSVLF